MPRLFSIIYALVATVSMGCLIVIMLATGYGTAWPIIGAVIGGLIIAVPIAWYISAKLYQSK